MLREWLFYIDDMIAFSEKVLSYTEKLDQTEFESNSLIYDATLRNLELIGEAATHYLFTYFLATNYCFTQSFNSCLFRIR